MKKLITLLMLSIFAVMNMNAAEQTLWTGSTDINWGDSNVLIPTTEMAEVPVGATIRLSYELVDMPENYHAMRITTKWWGTNPEDDLVAQFSLSSETPSTYEFTYSEACKALVDQREGMLIVGYGYKLTKVEAITDIAPKLLWRGSQEITGYAPGDGLRLNFKTLDITTACNMYLLVEVNGTGDLRFTNNNNGWANWPADGYNLCTGNIDANNIIKVALPQDFVTAVIEGEGLHQIVIWGDGLTIKGIATTKETLLNSVTTDANGYATYSSNNTLALNNLPAGLEAYTATLTGNTLSFAQKTDAVGPGTGLLIKGGDNTTYYIPAKTDATASFDNALKACVAGGDLASTENEYIFVMQKATTAGSLTFKKLSKTGVTMPANKAYVQVAASEFPAHELSISFGEGEVTGISDATLLNINEVIKNNNVYDLSGRRVAKPTKGLYIVNGKKVVIK